MNIILLGPPGTGKGTVAQFLEGNLGIKQISTGDLLREEIKKSTLLGKKSEPIIRQGLLVPDELLSEILEKNLKDNLEKGFVLEGYPRNLNQAQLLEKILKKLNAEIDLVLDIETSEDEIVRRLGARMQCSNCNAIFGLDMPSKREGICDKCEGKLIERQDDKPEIVRKRLQEYRNQAEPVISHYKKQKQFAIINANKPLREILKEVESIIKRKGV